MKAQFALLILAAAFLSACSRDSAPEEKSPADAAISEKELVVPIEGMVCMACASRVNQRLARMEGVTFVEADLAALHVRVRAHENSITGEEVAEAIREMGYKSGNPEAPEEAD